MASSQAALVPVSVSEAETTPGTDSQKEAVAPDADAELDEEGWPDLPEEHGPSSIDDLLGSAFATLFEDYSPDSEPTDAAAADVAAADVAAADTPPADVSGNSNAEVDEPAVAEPNKKKKKKKKPKRALASGFDSLADGNL
jgi:hypothetical protein